MLKIITEVDFKLRNDGNKVRQYKCLCGCGNYKILGKSEVMSGNTKSCGCLFATMTGTHRKSKDPLYKRWRGMKTRCYNQSDVSYHLYGGRGITVCDEWKDNFVAFYEWAIGNGYQKKF